MDGGHAAVNVGVVHLWDGVLVGCKTELECSALTGWSAVLHRLRPAMLGGSRAALFRTPYNGTLVGQTHEQKRKRNNNTGAWKCTKPPGNTQNHLQLNSCRETYPTWPGNLGWPGCCESASRTGCLR